MSIRHGSQVRLLRQSEAHTGGRPVKVGSVGEVIAMRDDPSGRKLLVKFPGHATPRHTPIEDVEVTS